MSLRINHIVPLVALICIAGAAHAQTVSTYDDFSAATLDGQRWQALNEDGAATADAALSGGILTITGQPNRAGFASFARIPLKGAVEADALGWTGTNQILQLYSGTGAFNHFIEFFADGAAADGTPTLHIWQPGGQAYQATSPVAGAISLANPSTLRIERDGTTYRFFANGALFYTLTSSALDNDARVFLYGWNTSVGKWDAVRLSGPSARITTPAPGSTIAGVTGIYGTAGPGTETWRLDWGVGASPNTWTLLTSGTGQTSGRMVTFDPGTTASGPITFRLTATDSQGMARAYWSTVTLDHAAIWEPLEGRTVGPAFTVGIRGGSTFAKARFYDNGALVAESTTYPFWGRIIPASDGAHTVSATLVSAAGIQATVPAVHVTVQRDLYGPYARVADNGRGFLFPNGQASVMIAEHDDYPWPDINALWANGDAATTDAYIANLSRNGVNVIRMWLESAVYPNEFLENPIGTYVPQTVTFWDRFLPICQKYGVTVLISPWETFWINLHWDQNPYNAANGGPCATVRDFIVSPTARQAQKNRIKYMIDRWGNSPAIFGIDILNEYDIWWDTVTIAERNAWVDDMVRFTQDYELQKWGHRHLITVSTTKNEPTGGLADTVYRHPLLDFATTHFYYTGTTNNPRNIIDPALSANHGIRYALSQIQDGRPFSDSEWGPIDLWPTILPLDFDNQYYHHFSWAHFASGGAGTGMRFPNRDPFTLTAGMHSCQKAISAAAADIVWNTFSLNNMDARITTGRSDLIAMGCGDDRQGIVWLTEDTRLGPAQPISNVNLTVLGYPDGAYLTRVRNAYGVDILKEVIVTSNAGQMTVPLPALSLDLAVTIRRILPGDINGDLSVSLADAVMALKAGGGLTGTTAAQTAAGDVVPDARVSLLDAVRIARAATGLDALP